MTPLYFLTERFKPLPSELAFCHTLPVGVPILAAKLALCQFGIVKYGLAATAAPKYVPAVIPKSVNGVAFPLVIAILPLVADAVAVKINCDVLDTLALTPVIAAELILAATVVKFAPVATVTLVELILILAFALIVALATLPVIVGIPACQPVLSRKVQRTGCGCSSRATSEHHSGCRADWP